MLGFLRFVGILNAAIWLGGGVFFTVIAGPSFSSHSMVQLLGRPRAGAAEQLLLGRYFVLQYWCIAVAGAHLLGEWLYAGRPIERFRLWLLGGLLALSLLGGGWLQPKLLELHLMRYGTHVTQVQRTAAAKSYAIWHGLFQGANFLVLAGLLVYFWEMTNPPHPPRFVSTTKFRG